MQIFLNQKLSLKRQYPSNNKSLKKLKMWFKSTFISGSDSSVFTQDKEIHISNVKWNWSWEKDTFEIT